MRLSSGEKLIKRLRAMGLQLPTTVRVRHTNAGRVQKAAGAWSWFLVDGTTGLELNIGGYEAITALLPKRLIATRSFGVGQSIDVEGYLLVRDAKRHTFDLWLVEEAR